MMAKSRTRRSQPRRNKVVALLGIGAILLIAVGTALSVGSEDYPTPPVAIEGNRLPRQPNPSLGETVDLAIGLPAPAIRGTSLAGEAIEIVPGSRPIVLMIVAHWCDVCQAEVPIIQGYSDEVGIPATVDFYAVVSSNDRTRLNYPAEEWLEREGWAVRTIKDQGDDRIASAYGLTAFPFFAVIAPNGTLVERFSGGLDRSALEQLFQQAAAMGRPSPPSAG